MTPAEKKPESNDALRDSLRQRLEADTALQWGFGFFVGGAQTIFQRVRLEPADDLIFQFGQILSLLRMILTVRQSR